MKSKFEFIALKCHAFVIWCNSIAQNDRPLNQTYIYDEFRLYLNRQRLYWSILLVCTLSTFTFTVWWIPVTVVSFSLSIYLLSLSFPLSLSFRCSLSFFLLSPSLSLSLYLLFLFFVVNLYSHLNNNKIFVVRQWAIEACFMYEPWVWPFARLKKTLCYVRLYTVGCCARRSAR